MTGQNTATPEEDTLTRLLGFTAAALSPERAGVLGLPDDELHREILLPLLPALLADAAIRKHWRSRSAGGFVHRLKAAIAGAGEPPQWDAADFEIPVTASYLAGPDARALSDTLLSEESLREMSAAILNTVLVTAWKELRPPSAPIPEAEADEVQPEHQSLTCSVVHGRPTRRSLLRVPDGRIFILRKLLSGRWFAQENRR